jgi:hypothetical protein
VVAQRPNGGSNASIVSEVVPNSRCFLRLQVHGFPARIAHRQIAPYLVFPIPTLRGILSWVTQLTNDWPDAFAELDVELDGSNPVFVQINSDSNYLVCLARSLGMKIVTISTSDKYGEASGRS